MIAMERREYRLKDAVEEIKNDYNYVFIDARLPLSF
jgi:cellulose biosynthesis protein BcsQ